MSKSYPPENDSGNNEYKFKLVNIDNNKIHKLATQLYYRVQEGNGEAIYTIGVKDNGTREGINFDELQETECNLEKACNENNFTMSLIKQCELSSYNSSSSTEQLYIAEYMIREDLDIDHINVNIAMIGNVNSGKSSTLSLLVYNKADNGRGLSRQLIFNYPHEIATGQTSSIAQHIIGFRSNGKCVNEEISLSCKNKDWSQIVNKSAKIVTLYDLAGHEKYLITTVTGLLSCNLDYTCVIVDINTKNILDYPMIREHIQLCVTMKIPFIVILTKIDSCDAFNFRSNETISSLMQFIKSPFVHRIPLHIENNDDILSCLDGFKKSTIVPIFSISNITKEGIPLVKEFLNICPTIKNSNKYINEPAVFSIKDIFMHVRGSGLILGGLLNRGKMRVGDDMVLGPFSDGSYKPIKIKTIELKKTRLTDEQYVKCGYYLTFSMKNLPCDKSQVKKNMVVLAKNAEKLAIYEFDAEIIIRKSNHSTTIRQGYCPMIFTSYFKQCASFVKIYKKYNKSKEELTENPEYLGPNDQALVRFKFIYRPEYLNIGEKIWMMDGIYKIVGKVKRVYLT